jgi:hypothetical protein
MAATYSSMLILPSGTYCLPRVQKLRGHQQVAVSMPLQWPHLSQSRPSLLLSRCDHQMCIEMSIAARSISLVRRMTGAMGGIDVAGVIVRG